ncbi:DNRLRE domain-containing protein [Aeromicrobium sp. Root344]|uniref:DNRLRE domain-containing protein n=1 Tax=Aeromicrobium sp. Root344 TaxID=1736521 RepID=UPI00138F2B05|nr:DNRLRE domain-containing protein [Aeromicrobium sp. Root344]
MEDLSARTPDSSTFAEPDGSWSVESYSGPIRTQDDDGKWVPLDSDLSKQDGSYAPAASALDLSFSDGGDSTIATVKTDQGDDLKVGWPDKLPAPTVDGSTLTYPDAADNGDLQVQSRPNGFSYSVILGKAPKASDDPLQFTFPLGLDGAKAAVTDDGGIQISDGKDKVASAPSPLMWDGSDANKDGNGQVKKVDTTIEGTGADTTLVLKPDMSYLTDPSTQYPVTIDPTFVVSVTSDTWVQSAGDTTSQIVSPELHTGSNDSGATVARSYLYFDTSNMSKMPKFAVNSAQVDLSNFETGACAGSPLTMSRITGGWYTGTVTWATQPAVTATGASQSSQSFGATGCSTEGTVSFDATQMVKDWAGGATNLGVRIAANDETAATGWRKFRSGDNGTFSKSPKLTVNYNSYPTTPSNSAVSPAITDGSTLVTSAASPKFTADVADPDGGQVDVKFKLLQGSTVVESKDLGNVNSGSAVYRTPPALADGTYTAQWQTSDSTLSSDWSDPITVKVDTTAPTAPTISCTSLSDGTWYDTAPASTSTCTVTASSDTDSLDATFNGAAVTLPDLSTGTTSKSFSVPANGVFDVAVTAKDGAGNTSTASFSIGTGNGALTSPGSQDRSTGDFVLNATAKAGAYSALVQWRPTGTTAWTNATQVKQGIVTWGGLTTSSGAMSTTGDLNWNAAAEPGMNAPSLIQVQVCFNYTTAPTQRCTATTQVGLVQHAFGGSFPTSTVGPLEVSLKTGEYQLTQDDVSIPGYDDTLSITRSYQSLGSAVTASADVFGGGWAAGFQGPSNGSAASQVVDKTGVNGTISLVDPDGTTATYVAKTGGHTAQKADIYKGQGDAANYNQRLEIKPTTPKTLVLTEDSGVVTTWDFLAPNVWRVKSVVSSPTLPATTFDYGSDAYVDGIYAGIPGVNCSATTQDKGCRALLMTYATIAGHQRLSEVDLKAWNPKPGADGLPGTGAGMVSVPVQRYGYDSNGSLTSEWDPRLDDSGNHVETDYGYQTLNGSTYLQSMTPPAQKPWNFHLASDASLVSVTRAQDSAVGGSDATWSVVYGEPTSGTGLPDVSAAAVGTWGQPVPPYKGTAVFGPDAPNTTDMTYADITYFTADGRTTNSASYGAGKWLIDSMGYNDDGNVDWTLDAANRDAGLSYGWSPQTIAWMLGTRTDYSSDGSRVDRIWEPNREVELEDGSLLYGRQMTQFIYDDQAATYGVPVPGRPGTGTDPDDPSPSVLVEIHSAVTDNTGGGGVSGAEHDPHNIRYRYDKVVPTDGDGWTLQVPTRISTSLGSGWSTQMVRYDTQGRVIETRTPQGVSTVDGAGTDDKSTVTSYYTADASSSVATCRNKPEWAGEICTDGPAGSSGAAPTSTTTGFDYLLNPTRVDETSGSMTRSTISTYDPAGRDVEDSTTVTGGPAGDKSIPDDTYTYSKTSGQMLSESTGAATAAATYDTWGRPTTQADGAGNTASTTYDTAGRVKTMNDGKGTYTYTWDGTDSTGKAERRGLITKLDAGLGTGPDEFTAAYDAGGNQTQLKYPNGITADSTYDLAGDETSLAYSEGGTSILAFLQIDDIDGRTRTSGSPLSWDSNTYDDRGRLTQVQDSIWGQCTTRKYTFSLDSDRTKLETSGPASGGACSAASPTTKTSTFDADDRITNAGYTYDAFGRTRTVPSSDTDHSAGDPATVDYFANDMVADISQKSPASTGQTQLKSYGLDPLDRLSTMSSKTDGVELRKTTNHYADGSDSPSWIDQQQRADASSGFVSSWTRNVMTPGGGLGLTQSSDGSSQVQMTNLHGDVVATLPNTTGAFAGLQNYSESDEYGNAKSATPALNQDYTWLGSKQRSHDTVGGVVLMGARLYNPTDGQFLSRDPVPGANDNAYTYPPDPINDYDTSGQQPWCGGGCGGDYDSPVAYKYTHTGRIIKGAKKYAGPPAKKAPAKKAAKKKSTKKKAAKKSSKSGGVLSHLKGAVKGTLGGAAKVLKSAPAKALVIVGGCLAALQTGVETGASIGVFFDGVGAVPGAVVGGLTTCVGGEVTEALGYNAFENHLGDG